MDPVVDLRRHYTPANYRRSRGLYGVSTALTFAVAIFCWLAGNIPAAIGFGVSTVLLSLLFRAARVRRQAATLDGVPASKHRHVQDLLGDEER